MQIGCGVTTKEIRGRRYLYFWHYEERGGRRVQAFPYLGALRSEAARQRLRGGLHASLGSLTAGPRRPRGEVLVPAPPPEMAKGLSAPAPPAAPCRYAC